MRPVQKILPLLALLIFATSALILMSAGAVVYKNAVQAAMASDDARTVTRYLATRIRTAPSPNDISLQDFQGENALCIQDSPVFQTIIYAYNGWLMEACVVKGGIAGPADGSRLLPLSDLSFAYAEDNLIKATGTLPNGDTFQILASVSGKGAAS